MTTTTDKEAFLQDPLAFFNPSERQVHGIGLHVTSRPAPPPIVVSFVDGIEVERFAAAATPWSISSDRGFPTGDRLLLSPVSDKSGDSVMAYELPWSVDHATWMELSSEADLFVTPQLTGCLVIVGGARETPRIVHASGMARTGVGAVLDRCGFFPPGPKSVWFDSNVIADAVEGWVGVCVFGLRDATTGCWRIYRHVAVMPKTGRQENDCRASLFWPRDCNEG